MNCRQLHDILNATSGGGKFAYSEMTPEKIKELTVGAECPIARAAGHNLTLRLVSAEADRIQGTIAFSCPLVRKGVHNTIYQEMKCHKTGSDCEQHIPRGDYEMGVGVEIWEEYPEL
jgi:hypothetical protein